MERRDSPEKFKNRKYSRTSCLQSTTKIHEFLPTIKLSSKAIARILARPMHTSVFSSAPTIFIINSCTISVLSEALVPVERLPTHNQYSTHLRCHKQQEALSCVFRVFIAAFSGQIVKCDIFSNIDISTCGRLTLLAKTETLLVVTPLRCFMDGAERAKKPTDPNVHESLDLLFARRLRTSAQIPAI